MRLRTARRRHSWVRATAFSTVLLLGGVALWSSLRYTREVTHAVSATSATIQAGALQQQQQAESEGQRQQPAGASLEAWTQLTDVAVKGGSGSSSSSSSGGGSSGGSGAASHGEQQQQQQAQGSAAAGAAEGAAGFVTVELRVLQAPPGFNSWVLAEDMLLFHRRALQQQLEQAYIGMALAAATGRAFILPPFACFCHASAAPLPRCRAPGRSDAQFPEACAEGDVLAPLPDFVAEPGRRGTPLDVRPHAAAAAIGQSDALLLRPSATILWPACARTEPQTLEQLRQCTREQALPGGGTALDVPPSLNDTHLLPFLVPYQKFKLWRLDFSDVGSPWHAFAGWDCAEPARAFDQRMSRAARPWPAPAGGGLSPMGMTTGQRYSDEPDMKDAGTCPAASGGGATAARRLRQEARRRGQRLTQPRGGDL